MDEQNIKNGTILIIEDEKDILELLEYTLTKLGYETIGFLSISKKITQILDEESIDLILMDRNLVGYEGSLYIKELKEKGYNQPVIYVSAKDKEEDILDGFDRYADDYITKPFNIKELCARVNAVIKRASKENNENFKVKDILYKASSKSFFIDEKIVKLTKLEHDLLLELVKNRDILLTREHLLNSVWDDFLEKKEKTVNVAIKRLKAKIDPTGEKKYIKSVRSEGYMFC